MTGCRHHYYYIPIQNISPCRLSLLERIIQEEVHPSMPSMSLLCTMFVSYFMLVPRRMFVANIRRRLHLTCLKTIHVKLKFTEKEFATCETWSNLLPTMLRWTDRSRVSWPTRILSFVFNRVLRVRLYLSIFHKFSINPLFRRNLLIDFFTHTNHLKYDQLIHRYMWFAIICDSRSPPNNDLLWYYTVIIFAISDSHFGFYYTDNFCLNNFCATHYTLGNRFT